MITGRLHGLLHGLNQILLLFVPLGFISNRLRLLLLLSIMWVVELSVCRSASGVGRLLFTD